MSKLKLIAEANSHEIKFSREFDAPVERVFKTYTDPALVPQWWGMASSKTIVDKMDVKKGGLWRYVQIEADGSEFAFNGVYHDVVPGQRIVHTFEFEGMPGHVLLETLTFEEKDGKTLITDSSVFQTVADRDGMIASGMEVGTEESFNRLESLLKRL
ncbi:SRPBCC family protein [Anaerolineales bacterium]